MPEYVVRCKLDGLDLDAFTRGYLECAEWCGIGDEDRESFEQAANPHWDMEAIAQATVECASFQYVNEVDLRGLDPAQCGHDFWLTRNRHGAGFWDRGLGERGQRLTTDAHAYGHIDVIWDGAGLLELY